MKVGEIAKWDGKTNRELETVVVGTLSPWKRCIHIGRGGPSSSGRNQLNEYSMSFVLDLEQTTTAHDDMLGSGKHDKAVWGCHIEWVTISEPQKRNERFDVNVHSSVCWNRCSVGGVRGWWDRGYWSQIVGHGIQRKMTRFQQKREHRWPWYRVLAGNPSKVFLSRFQLSAHNVFAPAFQFSPDRTVWSSTRF